MTDYRPVDVTDRQRIGGVQSHVAIDERHRLLADADRRAVLSILDETMVPLDLVELAQRVAGTRTPAGTPFSDLIQDVAITLHHNHLPKLEDAGLVSYDPEANRIFPR